MDEMKPLVEIIMGQIHSQVDDGIYKAVQNYGINVDKERLLQALKDAKEFWNEGYKDGYRAAVWQRPQWISVEERLPDEGVDVLTSRDGGVDVEARFRWGWERDDFHNDWRVTHWMPLPEPPEVEG